MEDKKLVLEDLHKAHEKVRVIFESVRYVHGVCLQDLDRALDKLELAKLNFERSIGAIRG